MPRVPVRLGFERGFSERASQPLRKTRYVPVSPLLVEPFKTCGARRGIRGIKPNPPFRSNQGHDIDDTETG
jgi:hypothetical protein